MAEINKKKIDANDHLKAMERVKDYRNNAEANVVLSFFKEPKLILDSTLTVDDFLGVRWKLCFAIAHNIIVKEGKGSLDEITVGFFLEQHPKMKEKFHEFGGFDSLVAGIGYIQIDNYESYVADMKKWKTVMTLAKTGLSLTNERVSKYADMKSDDIYNELMVDINSAFRDTSSGTKVYSLTDNLDELINKLDTGSAVGLPYYNMPRLSHETGGQNLGTITLLGGISNAGKSTVARSMVIPSILENSERVVVMINEDSYEKWQREMLVWTCNNILHYDIQKHTVRNGNYTTEVRTKLKEAAEWLEEKNKGNHIILVPFLQYKTANAIKEIRKYAAQGVKYFILDTFKMDAGEVNDNSWLAMQQAMVDIKDVVKSEALNAHIMITFQLEKGSSTIRYYTQSNIGMAKNIVDVASTCIMIRDLYPDEYPGGKREIEVFYPKTDGSTINVIEPLQVDKKYQLFFIVKNQEGAANGRQIAVEHDKSRNIMKEIGFTNLSPDF